MAQKMFGFLPKNLNVLTPVNIALGAVVLALLQLFGVTAVFSTALWSWSSLTVTTGTLLLLLLAVGVLWDAKR